MATLLADIRFGARMLLKSPTMTIIALRNSGLVAEADRLVCIYREATLRLPRTGLLGEEREVDLIIIAVLTGRNEQALRGLDQLSRRNPASIELNPAMSLRYHPGFAALAGDPRFAAIDERLRTAMNVQRQQAGLPPIDREAWISDPKTLLTKN